MERVPLSFAQRRLWLIDQLEGPSSAYNIPIAVRFSGHVNEVALEAALRDVVARHESLRTVFTEVEGTPWQTIRSPKEAEVALELLSATETDLAGKLSLAADHCFDLRAEIPLRAWLFRLEGRADVLLLLLHHTAGDGWSLSPLARDVSTAYAARSGGQQPNWAPLRVQYADYTLWQRELLGDEQNPESIAARQLTYWQRTLAGSPEELRLPLARPRPRVPSHRGDRIDVFIDARLHTSLQRLAREARASLFMVLQAGLVALLSRLGVGEDIPIGTPIAGRTDDGLDDLVGFFVNTLVLRTDVSGNPSTYELLARVREVDLGAYANQELPFERLVEVLNPARSLARNPLFQVVLALQNNTFPQFDFPGLEARFEPVGTLAAKFDLLFNFVERCAPDGSPQGVAGHIEYSCDLFDRPSMEALAVRLIRLLNGMIADPSRPIDGIDLLEPSERRQLLIDWNNTGQPLVEETLPELFEAQVWRTPNAVALLFGEAELTYAELNSRANQFAHYLIGLGIGPEDRVGLCMDRSLEMVITLLAILKAGASYLPLDPDYPAERLAYMIRDAEPQCVVCHTTTAQDLPAGVPVLLLDDPRTEAVMKQEAHSNPINLERVRPLHPLNPAYVIYTSGSTGLPKGVVGTHNAMCNRVRWGNTIFQQNAIRNVIAKSAFSFIDGSTELLGPLINGICVFLAEGDTSRSSVSLAKTLSRHRIEAITLVPSLAYALLDDANHDQLSSCRLWICSGEPLATNIMENVIVKVPNLQLFNFYGASEVCGDSTFINCTDYKEVAIGRPIWNTRVYVLDSGLQPVPAGIAGELYISGLGLARGYLGRSALTADRFVADPFGRPGGRMYRTGDLARWRTDGVLDFLGRVDDQVKIRGFRIEPGEVEAILSQHNMVAQTVVIAREDSRGHNQLIGYVVAAPGQAIDPTSVRRFADKHLPDYMVPTAIIVLDSLPLTPSGKLDRQALPSPTFAAASSRPPRTSQEQILAGLFAELLDLERVGIDDNFFDLGGHSLLALRLQSHFQKATGEELPLRLIFEKGTVAGIISALAEP